MPWGGVPSEIRNGPFASMPHLNKGYPHCERRSTDLPWNGRRLPFVSTSPNSRQDTPGHVGANRPNN